MKIIVCVKQVPNTNEVKIDPVKGTLIRDGVPSILNPDDANALEAALRLKDKYPDVTVTVMTMGLPQASFMLRECLAMGADDAILITDRPFGGADTWATSNTLASAIRKFGKFDIVFAGRQAIDGDTAQVGPQTAERLGIPQVTYVMDIDFDRDANKLTVKRKLEDGYEVIELKAPALLTAVKELNTPRYMNIGSIVDAYEKQITSWALKDLDVEASQVGLEASPTKVMRSFTPDPKGKGVMLQGTTKVKAQLLVDALMQKHVI